MAARVGTNRPIIRKNRSKLPARTFTDGSEYSVRERLRRLRSDSNITAQTLQGLCTEFVSMGKSASNDSRLSETEKVTRQRLGRKASSIRKSVVRLAAELQRVSADIELAYDREQGNLLASMDQVQRVNPTWIDISGLITNPNQVVVSRRGVGARKKVAAAAAEAAAAAAEAANEAGGLPAAGNNPS
jgi:hypothetical protein